MIYLELIYVFFKIGLLSFGGGYAMLSLIQFDVVDYYSWMSVKEFTDMLAISQMTPGPVSINTATYVGYATAGILGAVAATSALCAPSMLLMILVIKFLFGNKDNHFVKHILSGLKPVLGGLILAAGLLLLTRETFSDFGWGQNNITLLIFVGSFVALYFYKVNPMILLPIAGVLGVIFF